MATKGKRPLRNLTASDKIEAIQRIHDGESKASVARDIGVPESTLRGWCKNEDKLRYMSRQSTPDGVAAVGGDDSGDSLGISSAVPEKRTKYDYTSATKPPKYDFSGSLGVIKNGVSASGLDLSGVDKRMDTVMDSDLGASSMMPSGADLVRYGAELSGLKLKSTAELLSAAAATTKPADLSGASLASKSSDLSMSAISPLSNLNHLSGLSGLAQSPLGLSFNEIASNLGLLAQFSQHSTMAAHASTQNSLRNVRASRSTLQPSPTDMTRNSRSHRSGVDVTDTALNLATDKSNRNKHHHTPPKEPPVDDALWYWVKSQQAYLGLNNPPTSQSTRHSQNSHRSSSASVASNIAKMTARLASQQSLPGLPPLSSIPESQKSSWFWQWYKQFNNTMAGQSKPNNILFSQLTKGKDKTIQPENIQQATSDNGELPVYNEMHSDIAQNMHIPQQIVDNEKDSLLENSPKSADDINVENIPSVESQSAESDHSENTKPPSLKLDNIKIDRAESPKNPTKVRAVLDNLLFNNNNNDDDKICSMESKNGDEKFAGSPREALEHGEKFLQWLEACSDPSVTAMQVMQFKYLLNNVRSYADRKNSADKNIPKDKISRRK
ncbi:protein distal antenna [Ctenocephalides felis]|uniref:protein distal antenna n=1 Tax=Ctenocephalides felis TaxID=7515 RepID=UPI000E6E4EB9|nr:protein distal antenna [Ctenocephalides felis]